ncbi:hypothetical protein BLNAU_21416 [Blattamonas nauphoetae]|uniref:Uncharacterized protein n=1 Tax=Blattamonas nauphoetae TaxID=2049346 RepID=A0ABQ9WWH1_9EUKA|nr:hypothetical protein BLNAU_21416 [Blattamonas nauphoetae]
MALQSSLLIRPIAVQHQARFPVGLSVPYPATPPNQLGALQSDAPVFVSALALSITDVNVHFETGPLLDSDTL